MPQRDRRGAEWWVWDVNTLDWIKGQQPTLEADAVTIDGTVTIQDGGGSITVDGPLTDAQLRATPITVTGGGGGTEYADGAVRGTATGSLVMGDDGTNIQSIKVDAAGELQVDVLTMPVVAVTQSGTWDEVGINDSGNSITVDYATTGSGTATGALRVELPTDGTGKVGLNAGTANIGDVDVLTVPAPLSTTGGGTEATALRVTVATDSTGVLSVDDNGGNLSIDDGGNVITVDGSGAAGTAATGVVTVQGIASMTPVQVSQATAANLNADTNLKSVGGTAVVTGGVNGTQGVGGPTASGSNLTANPLTTGGLARTSPPTAVANAQVVNAQMNIYGEQIVRHALRETKGHQATTITGSAAETTIVTADATYKLDLYGLILTNSSATATNVTIKDSTGGTTRMTIYVPAGDTRGFMLPACDGHKQNAANNNWTATSSQSITSLFVTAMFVQNL